ncbi:hypothetical protein JHK87_026023 [Glycine soja]|nr:hypothetical protein JHK87_026023 [Glycine soja]
MVLLLWHAGRDPDPKSGSGARTSRIESVVVLVELVEAPGVGSGGVFEFLVQIVVVDVVIVEIVVDVKVVVGVRFVVGAFFHGVHGFEVEPGGRGIGAGVVEAGKGEVAEALDFGAVPFAELLHLVAALHGGFGRGGGVGALRRDGVGHLLPMGGLEVGAAEGVPFVAVGVDEGGGFLGGSSREEGDGGRRWREGEG